MNYFNQKRIIIPAQEVEQMYNLNKNDQFLHSLSWDSFGKVIRELSGNELKVWLYCMKWSGKGSVYFSPAALTEDFGISESTAQRAFKTLENLHYITFDKNTRTYIFHPLGMPL